MSTRANPHKRHANLLTHAPNPPIDQQPRQVERARATIGEARSQIRAILEQRLEEASADRRELRAKLAETEERLRAATDVAHRREILAPEDGTLVNQTLFPAANNSFFGRFYMYLDQQPQIHTNLITASGIRPGETATTNVVYGGQFGPFMANYYDANNPSSVIDDWQHAGTQVNGTWQNATMVPTGRWACIEWQFKGDTNEMHRSSPEASGSIKYTRTGRVSKATKGQRVHHCEECGKVSLSLKVHAATGAQLASSGRLPIYPFIFNALPG